MIMLVEQDAKLGQLCQTIGQLQEEEKKMAGWAEKLTKELKGEFFMVGITVGVISWLDGPLQCLQTIVGGSRHSSMCWSRRLEPSRASSTP